MAGFGSPTQALITKQSERARSLARRRRGASIVTVVGSKRATTNSRYYMPRDALHSALTPPRFTWASFAPPPAQFGARLRALCSEIPRGAQNLVRISPPLPTLSRHSSESRLHLLPLAKLESECGAALCV
jgi:hypothetical protein